jgi:GTPase SAR1 family protein
VGNKSDLVDRREVSVAEGEALGVSEKTIFVETSAKAGFNVKALFRKIACALPGSDEVDSKKRKQRKQDNELVELTLTAAPVQSASGCAC